MVAALRSFPPRVTTLRCYFFLPGFVHRFRRLPQRLGRWAILPSQVSTQGRLLRAGLRCTRCNFVLGTVVQAVVVRRPLPMEPLAQEA